MSFINFNGKWINQILSTTSVSHSGNTNNTILGSVVVPANTYKAGDLIQLDSMFEKIGTAGITTLRFYWVSGATPTLSGAIQLSIRGFVAANRFSTQTRRLYIRTANGTGSGLTLGTELLTTTGGIFYDYFSSQARSNASINWTVTGTIFCTVQLGNSADQVIQHYLKIWEW